MKNDSFKKSLEIKKGDEINRLMLLKLLSQEIDDKEYFKEVREVGSTFLLYNPATKIVAKKSFKVTLIIETI